jgi:hypothetical protein
MEEYNLTNLKNKYFIFVTFLIIAPIFFILEGSSLRLSTSFSSDLTGKNIVSIAVLAVPVLIFINLFYLKSRVSIFASLVLLLLFLLPSIGYFLGILFFEDANSSKSFNRLIQSIIPLCSFMLAIQVFSGINVERKIELMEHFYKYFQFFLLIICFLYILQTIFAKDLSHRFSLLADHIGPFYNPKVKRFFPAILAGIVCYNMGLIFFSLWKKNILRKKPLLILIFFLIVISAYWGRTAFAAIGLTFVYLIFVTKSFRLLSYILVIAVISSISIYIISHFFDISLSETTSFFRVISMLSSDGLSYGDSIRIERLLFAVSEMFKTPFGSGFLLYEQHNLQAADIAIAENGFLDLGVRSGFIAPLMVFLITMAFIIKLNKLAIKSSSESVFALGSFLFSQIICVGLFLHIFSELYYGMYTWFWFGAVCVSVFPLINYLRSKDKSYEQ